MKKDKEFELVVAQGEIPWWRVFLAAILFTGVIYNVYLLIIYCNNMTLDSIPTRTIPDAIKKISSGLVAGIALSITKTVLIDIDKNKLISRYAVGPFSRDVLTVVPELEYVSVFFNSKEEYEVNLWYKGNKHYKMYTFIEKEHAHKFGVMVAQKLNIDLLDATEKGNNKWIEKVTI